MILRYFAIIGLILCGFSQQTATADPSNCEERLHYLEWTQKYFDSADAVFLGKVVAGETPDPPAQPASKPADAGTMTELLEMIEAGQSRSVQPDRLQTATLKVDKSWKGQVGRTVTIKANLYWDDTGPHASFRTKDVYLVFAYKGDNEETLHVPVGCASHQSLKETASKIRVLDALTKKPGTRSVAQGNEPLIQADVYNALYEAYVQCDDNLDQSRSEFITDKLERGRGNGISIEVLRKLLTHNVQIANQSIADTMKERELYVSEILGAHKESFDQPVDPAEAPKDRHKEVRKIDDFLKAKRQYVEIHECVLRVL